MKEFYNGLRRAIDMPVSLHRNILMKVYKYIQYGGVEHESKQKQNRKINRGK